MRVLFPVLLRLAAATSLFSIFTFFYGQQLKIKRRNSAKENPTNFGQIINDEVNPTEKHNDATYGQLPISAILRTYLSGARKRCQGSGANTIPNVRAIQAHPHHSKTEIGTSLYHQVVLLRMQGENSTAQNTSEIQTVNEDSGHGHLCSDGQEVDIAKNTLLEILSEEQSFENSSTSLVDINNGVRTPINDELFDSATSMTFTSDIETPLLPGITLTTSQFTESLPNIDQCAIVRGLSEDSSGSFPICRTPDSDPGIETLCSDEDVATTSETEDTSNYYYSGNLTDSVYWNKDFQDLDWLQRSCSPIAEEPEEESEEAYSCIRSSRSGSSTSDSSSDLVYETIFSTSHNPEEINDNDLADLKDDPDFVLLLQNDYKELEHEDANNKPEPNIVTEEKFNISAQVPTTWDLSRLVQESLDIFEYEPTTLDLSEQAAKALDLSGDKEIHDKSEHKSEVVEECNLSEHVPTTWDSSRHVPPSLDLFEHEPATLDSSRQVPMALDMSGHQSEVLDRYFDKEIHDKSEHESEVVEECNLSEHVPTTWDSSRHGPPSLDLFEHEPATLDSSRQVPMALDMSGHQSEVLDKYFDKEIHDKSEHESEVVEEFNLSEHVPTTWDSSRHVPPSLDLFENEPATLDSSRQVPMALDLSGHQSEVLCGSFDKKIHNTQEHKSEVVEGFNLSEHVPTTLASSRQLPKTLDLSRLPSTRLDLNLEENVDYKSKCKIDIKTEVSLPESLSTTSSDSPRLITSQDLTGLSVDKTESLITMDVTRHKPQCNKKLHDYCILETFSGNMVQTCLRKVFKQLFILSYASRLASDIISSGLCHDRQAFRHDTRVLKCHVISSPSQNVPKILHLEEKYELLKSFEMSQNTLVTSTSTQTDLTLPDHVFIPKKSMKNLQKLQPETVSKIPRKLQYKVWKRLRTAKRKYEFYAKHKKKANGYHVLQSSTSRNCCYLESYVTIAHDNNTAIIALVLAESLRRTNTSRNTCIIIGTQVRSWIRQLLADVYNHVYMTSELCSHDDLALSLLGRPELGVTFTKLHCWRLTQFQKCVYLDADTLVLQNCDELFEREELSAVPDTGWPDCFNSGVFVFQPSLETYAKLISLAISKGSFDGGDQGLLNTYFGNWRSSLARRLPFIYNMVSNVSYTYAPALKQYASGVKIVHFLGADKPWSVRWRTDNGAVELEQHQSWDLHVPFLQAWVQIFREKLLPKLPEVALTYARNSATVTVIELLYRAPNCDFEQSKDQHMWGSGDTLVHEHFPSHVHAHPHPESEPYHENSRSLSPKIPSHPEPRPPSPGTPNHPESRPLSSEIPARTEPTPPPERRKSVYEEPPSDPHWEALLWHTVQSPWEPPSPPPPDEYQPPPSQQYQEPVDPNPTFGWFSADSGAQEPPPIPPVYESEHVEAPSIEPLSISDLEQSEEEPSLYESETDSSFKRMKSWEDGEIDYLGKDRFENIWKKLEYTFAEPEETSSELEDLKNSLKGSIAQGQDPYGSVASSSLLEDDLETLVPDEESPEPEEIWPVYADGDYSGMLEWQEGRIDYCGRDRSDNIMRRLDFIISGRALQDDP